MLLAAGWLPPAPDNRHSVTRDPIDDDHSGTAPLRRHEMTVWTLPRRQDILTAMSVIVVPDALPQEPLAALRVLTDSEHELERIRREQVIAARSAGASWQQIGDALGVTRQSAWESFTATTREALASNVDANSTLDEDDALELAVEEVRAVRRRRATS